MGLSESSWSFSGYRAGASPQGCGRSAKHGISGIRFSCCLRASPCSTFGASRPPIGRRHLLATLPAVIGLAENSPLKPTGALATLPLAKCQSSWRVASKRIGNSLAENRFLGEHSSEGICLSRMFFLEAIPVCSQSWHFAIAVDALSTALRCRAWRRLLVGPPPQRDNSIAEGAGCNASPCDFSGRPSGKAGLHSCCRVAGSCYDDHPR